MESILFDLNDRKDLIEHIKERCSISRTFLDFGKTNIDVYEDGETCPDLLTSVRGKRVYILSSPDTPLKIIQLNLAIDAAKRAAAREIIAVIPYFPYARQDKKDQARGPIGAKVMAEMIENRGATSIITFDLHADQIQGFFNIPVMHMEGKYIFDRVISGMCVETSNNVALCAPDAGAAKRVKQFRDRMKDKYGIDLPMVHIDKTRKKANEIDEMVIIGDVENKNIIIIDDMCDTGGTLCKAADELIEQGAISVAAIVTHGIFSGPAFERFSMSKLSKIICSDTLPLRWVNPYGEEPDTEHMINGRNKVEVITTAGQIMNAIIAINENISVEDLKYKNNG